MPEDRYEKKDEVDILSNRYTWQLSLFDGWIQSKYLSVYLIPGRGGYFPENLDWKIESARSILYHSQIT